MTVESRKLREVSEILKTLDRKLAEMSGKFNPVGHSEDLVYHDEVELALSCLTDIQDAIDLFYKISLYAVDAYPSTCVPALNYAMCLLEAEIVSKPD